MMIEIFGPNISPFVKKVLAAADYKGLAYTYKNNVSISELSKLSPVTGKVPVARFDGEAVFDSSQILRRFDEVQPRPALLSDDARVMAKQRVLEDWSDESLYHYLLAFRWSDANRDRSTAQITQFLPTLIRPLAKPVLRRMIGGQPRAQGLGRLPSDMLMTELETLLDDLAVVLGNEPFFYAERPSMADFSIYGMFGNGDSGATPDFAEAVAGRSTLTDWRKRVDDAIGVRKEVR